MEEVGICRLTKSIYILSSGELITFVLVTVASWDGVYAEVCSIRFSGKIGSILRKMERKNFTFFMHSDILKPIETAILKNTHLFAL